MIASQTTMAKALMDFFGMTSGEAIKEYKPLTTEEKEFFRAELTRVGYKIAPAA